MPLSTLEKDFAVIDANHQAYQYQNAQLIFFKILLRMARKQWVGLKDKWLLSEIVERYPDLEFYAKDEPLFKPRSVI